MQSFVGNKPTDPVWFERESTWVSGAITLGVGHLTLCGTVSPPRCCGDLQPSGRFTETAPIQSPSCTCWCFGCPGPASLDGRGFRIWGHPDYWHRAEQTRTRTTDKGNQARLEDGALVDIEQNREVVNLHRLTFVDARYYNET